MKMLTLAIVIPVYNEANYLEACLEALECQTVPPDEVIVVDNNSTDASVRIAARFPFVKVITEKQQGIVHARNRGFDTANSDIIGRIDADTHLEPTWIATVKSLAATMEVNEAMTGPCRFYDARLPLLTFGFHRIIYFWTSRLTFGHPILYGSNMFFFRSQWRLLRQEACQDNAIHEDMDLAAHIVQAGGMVRFNPYLPAQASARRFRNWRYYPTKWARTWLAHGLIPARYQAVREIYQADKD